MVAWFEIPAEDIDRAVNFYAAVFDYRFRVENFNGAKFAVFSSLSNASVKGTIMEVKEKPKENAGTVLFFYVPDITTTLDKILESNGEVIQPKKIMKNVNAQGEVTIAKTLIDNNTGYFAYFKDSEGNKMGLYSNS